MKMIDKLDHTTRIIDEANTC